LPRHRRRRHVEEQRKGNPVNRPIISTRRNVRLGVLIPFFLCLAGCDDNPTLRAGARGTFSEVYSRFDPAAEFVRLGFKVEADTEGGRISTREMYGWKPIQGSLQLPADATGCEAVAAAIRRSLDRVLDADCIDELNEPRQRQRGQPLYGVLRYDREGMRGHIYVWLFPNESETKINYAILLREELLSGTSRRFAASF
jgi:hypothetical protein